MKLSNVLKYKKYLEGCTVRPAADLAFDHLGDIVNSVQTNQLQFGEFSQTLQQQFATINGDFEKFQETIARLNRDIDAVIESLQPAYFVQSYRMYEEMVRNETVDYILDRPLKDVTEDVYDFITARIELYDEWKYPAMIIRPGRESFIDRLVACDPLYLVDQNHELLEPAKQRFGEKYQARLRTYIMREHDQGEILPDIPNDQFGFVLAYNFFNFRPLEVIERYFTEIYKKLKPGGTLALTYNNCDFFEGTGLTECFYMCYTPGMMLEQLAKKIGYDIYFRYDTHMPNTWLELRKPGILQSLRGGQSMAKIVRKEY
jgi:SAM-dependent methyltransferase